MTSEADWEERESESPTSPRRLSRVTRSQTKWTIRAAAASATTHTTAPITFRYGPPSGTSVLSKRSLFRIGMALASPSRATQIYNRIPEAPATRPITTATTYTKAVIAAF